MTAAAGFTPPVMDWNADDLPDELDRFSQYCELVFHGPFSEKTEKERVAYLLLWIGRPGVEVYQNATWDSAADKHKVRKVFEKLDLYLQPKVNPRLARFQLQQFRQRSDESVDEFLTRCKQKTSRCKFRDDTELKERLIEQIIIGTKHSRVQERLLEKGDSLTLDQALDIARTYESTLQHMAQLAQTPERHNNTGEVHAVSNSKPSSLIDCSKCGTKHRRGNCPAYGSKCKRCGKPNHWQAVCFTKLPQGQPSSSHRTSRSPSRSRTRRPSRSPSVGERFDTLYFEAVNIEALDTPASRTETPPSEAYATIRLDLGNTQQPATLRAKVDTGAQGNILPLRLYRDMFPENITDGYPVPGSLRPSSTILSAYGGNQIKQCGVCRIRCTYDGCSTDADFYVADCPGKAILGLPTATVLKLVVLNCSVDSCSQIQSKDDLIAQYPNSFDGIGKFPGQYHITLDPNVPPVVHSYRRVPVAMKPEIKMELDDMVANGIITKIKEGEPTAWVNSLVYRHKANGRLRLCLDPKDLNEAILREHHVTATLEEIIPKLSGATVFSTVDVKCGYWNVELDEESSYLTTFNSPFGRYRFLRMPFGLKMSQDIFQARIDQTFEGCPGVTGIADDIVVYGKSEQDHDKNMHGMMARCVSAGIKLNPDKCQIKEDKIQFYGVICSNKGIQPDPKKISALQQMAPPKDQREMLSFLGLVTYMSTFIPNASSLTAPLRDLTKKDQPYEWSTVHQDAFDRIKSLLSDQVTLQYFDSQKPITLQVDASSKGLGATLLQDGKPVACASKALTEAESRYANIERELLAVVYGCERFHTYLFGQSFTVDSDHKPLESIKLKHLRAAPPRLQRMLLRLQPYDFTIKYCPGKDVPIADALSRLSPEETTPLDSQEVSIHTVFPQFSQSVLQHLREESSKDPELTALRSVIITGWPNAKKDIPPSLRSYWNFRDELTVEDGLIMKSHRLVIPASMKEDMLQNLHAAHQGSEKTKLRARSTVFWTGINRDIENLTASCPTCQKYQCSQTREPLMQLPVPPRAWHTVATDLFHLGNAEYLIVADYFSKYFFIRKLPSNQTSSKVISLLKEIFGEHGIPTKVMSDNGPQYSSQAFKAFATEYGFQHDTSSPHHPRSNGFIESQVKIAKKAMQKAIDSNMDPQLAFLCLRSTPVDHDLPSPAELFLGRQVQDNLPRKTTSSEKDIAIRHQLQQRQERQKTCYDRQAKPLTPLADGQLVNIQHPDSKLWEPGKIVHAAEAPRSYIVHTDHSRQLRRNRVHLRKRRDETSSTKKRVRFEAPEQVLPEAMATESGSAVLGQTRTHSGRIVKPKKLMNLCVRASPT